MANNSPFMGMHPEALSGALQQAYQNLNQNAHNPERSARALKMIDQINDAHQASYKNDYCKHGKYLHTEWDIPCGACEMGE